MEPTSIITQMKGALASIALVALLGVLSKVVAHGGGLDTYGCHHDRRREGYHRHRGPLAGRASILKEETLRDAPVAGAGRSDTWTV